MILDIVKPTGGSISILGSSSALEVRERIGYLPEGKGAVQEDEGFGHHRPTSPC